MPELRRFGEKIIDRFVPNEIKPHFLHYARMAYVMIESTILHGGRDLPIAISVETNSACNRKCYYCPRPTDQTNTLSEENFHLLIGQLRDWGFRGRISPQGYNEPLTDKRLPDLLAYAKDQLPDSELVVFTNGDLLTNEKMELLKSVGVSEVKVSLHEPTAEEQERKILTLADQHKEITIIERRDGKRGLPLSNVGGLVEVGETESLKNCYHIYLLIVRADGNVVLCCRDVNKENIFGNIEVNSVEEIWNEERFTTIRQEIKRGQYTLPLCQRCGYEKNW